MSGKKLSFVMLIACIVVGAIYIKASTSFIQNNMSGGIDAGYFPRIIAFLLIGLCVISLIRTLREKEYKIDIGNIHLVLLSITATVVYFALWNVTGLFYPLTFLYILSLFLLFKPRPILNKGIILLCVLSLSMTLFIYLVFDQVMKVQF